MQQHTQQLKRALGLPLLTLYGLGTILGAGIYVLIGKVAGVSGMYAPIAFLTAATVAGLTGLSYGQLAVRLPYSAGEAVYVKEAFGLTSLAAFVGYLVMLTGLVSAATMAKGFAGYFLVFVDMPSYLAILFLITVVVMLACWGIAESVTVAAIMTLLEVAGLLLIVFLLRDTLFNLPLNTQKLLPLAEASIWLGIGAGAFLAFYAFIGFEDMVNVVEEVREPKETMPLAIILALMLAGFIYVLVALVAVLSMPAVQLSESDSPMVALLQGRHPQLALVIGLISLIAIVNGVIVQLIMGSRLLYGLSMRAMAPRLFSHIFPATQTPIRATLLIGLLIALFALMFPLLFLAKLTSFIIVIVFMLVNASLLVVAYKQALPGILNKAVPLLAIVLCGALLVFGLLSTVE